MRILVSACLLGAACRYDGKSVPNRDVLSLLGTHELIPVCPEQLGGLPTPRAPAERVGDRVINRAGEDVTEHYRRGAEEAVRLCRLYGCRLAILKERSPSCSVGQIYDGSFSRTLIDGIGVCAAALRAQGVEVIGESEVKERLLCGDVACFGAP